MDWEAYLTKAQENLATAQWAYQNGKYNPSASRAYYAVFLAELAILVSLTDYRRRGMNWDHGQVQAELNRRLNIHQKVLPSRLGSVPRELIGLRHDADYETVLISQKKAQRALDKVVDFVAEVTQVLGG
jgi:uncharacterized protein (UPF0332 family)